MTAQVRGAIDRIRGSVQWMAPLDPRDGRRTPAALALAARVALVLGLVGAPSGLARAEGSPWSLHLDGEGALALSEPQASLFAPGAMGAIGVYRAVGPQALVGARLRLGALIDGPAPADRRQVDPGMGTLASVGLGARLRLFESTGATHRNGGPYLEAVVALAATGELLRGSVEGAAGWGFALGPLTIGPTLRYLQVVQPAGGVSGADARVVLAGLEVVLSDAGEDGPERAVEPEPAPRPGDRDGDGVLDEVDGCPEEPEDRDGFQDADGCPDVDNDGDGVLDRDDGCPSEPEDRDHWQDEDGCPEVDNDHDGIADAADQCPNEPEVVNGIADADGCPDEGLIEFVEDRVIIDEQVLFDTNRSRVRGRAQPVLRAIAELWRQHPEWLGMRIEGHADVRGNEPFNLALSVRRANNAKRALVALGMDEARILVAGFGSSRPRRAGRGERVHRQNRRVEFVALLPPGSTPTPAPAPAVAEPLPAADDERMPDPLEDASAGDGAGVDGAEVTP